MNLLDWDGHDSLIEEVVINVAKRTVTVRGTAYRIEPGHPRVPLTILFTDVDAVTTAADMAALAKNAFAGQMNHAHLNDGKGTSHLYLVEGYMAVTSRRAPQLILGD